ncbi:MAG TPA: chemotaxis protein CheW, partial [Gemmatimonadales bacterium]|nr:chemotaxis protein CheW [Gemmatimonadales bacterium]
MNAWLLVRSSGRAFAVPMETVELVCEVGTPVPAPARAAAVRGVVPVAGRLVPLAHLGALVLDQAPPAAQGTVGIVVRDGGRRLVFEVDEAPGLERGPVEPLPTAWRGGWAAAAVRGADGLVPLLDVAHLFE